MKKFKEFVAEAKEMEPKHHKLLKDIKNELHNDLHWSYDGDHAAWSEVVRDVPSDSLSKLYSKIPKKHAEHFQKEINSHIKKLGK